MDLPDDQGLGSVLLQMGGVALQEETVDRLLALVAQLTERTVHSASAVSLTLVRNGDEKFTPHASEAVARQLDDVQYEADEGPCLQALTKRELVNASLPTDGGSWPRFTIAAIEHGIQGVLSVPLVMREQSLGGLNIYSREHHRFSDTEVTTASLLADQAAAVVASAVVLSHATELNEQLRDALASRDIIGQAKGILMERDSCSPDEAFDVLRRASQRTNRKLRDVAADIVASVTERSSER